MSWAWTSHKEGLDRLADLPAEAPYCASKKRSLEPLPGKDFIRSLREHACRHVKGKYLDDRKALWDQEVVDMYIKPEWMTLRKLLPQHLLLLLLLQLLPPPLLRLPFLSRDLAC